MQIKKIITWALTAFLSIWMLLAGYEKLQLTGEERQLMRSYFLVFAESPWIQITIGILEIIAGIAISLIAKLRIPALLGIMLIMLGAIYSHLQIEGDLSRSKGAILAFFFSALCIYLWRNFYPTDTSSSM